MKQANIFIPALTVSILGLTALICITNFLDIKEKKRIATLVTELSIQQNCDSTNPEAYDLCSFNRKTAVEDIMLSMDKIAWQMTRAEDNPSATRKNPGKFSLGNTLLKEVLPADHYLLHMVTPMKKMVIELVEYGFLDIFNIRHKAAQTLNDADRYNDAEIIGYVYSIIKDEQMKTSPWYK